MDHADEAVEAAPADGIALMRDLEHPLEGIIRRELRVEPGDVGRRDHDVARLAVGEAEDVVQHLLLGARDDPGALGLVDERAQLVGRPDGVPRDHVADAQRTQEQRGGALQHPDGGPQHDGDHLDRPGDERRERLRHMKGQRLGDELAEHHRQVRDDAEGEREIRPGGQQIAEQSAHERLGEGADEDADRRDPDLDGGDDPHGVVHQAQGGARARTAGLRPPP